MTIPAPARKSSDEGPPSHPGLGIDVGSATVKVILSDHESGAILWKHYQRHQGRPLATLLEVLRNLEGKFPMVRPGRTRVFVTGSGAPGLKELIGARFVHEVNAVALAAERFHPGVGSVVELGGQDAKIIIFRDQPGAGGTSKILTMNDKCAGGTGAVIDKIGAKLGIGPQDIAKQRYEGVELHHIAARCGVFAETDVNSLQVMGIPNDQILASLFGAIVTQNLTVLTRGYTLRPKVLLLGGPNTFIVGLQEAWRERIVSIWQERGTRIPDDLGVSDLIVVPPDAQYYGAIGALEFGLTERGKQGQYLGTRKLEAHLTNGRLIADAKASPGLTSTPRELDRFFEDFRPTPFIPPNPPANGVVKAFLGLDGGSTSTKAVLLDPAGEVLQKAYRLSQGNPIEDARGVIGELRASVERQGASLEVLGFAVTGYARDVLKEMFGADLAIVETVAHTASALASYGKVDVVCDVGGQDIKLMVLKNGQVKDFKLNTQCSAGNGYFLQSTAGALGIPISRYAELAFEATTMPRFTYGCAVFLQSDVVDFQRRGWAPNQILAGLATVLPKNVWLHVANIPNPARVGTTFVLQGGTHRNLAVVKAHVDFIRSKFRDSGREPRIIVHEHCGESGAIGAALEARRVYKPGSRSDFVGLDKVARIRYTKTTSEATRCGLCKNGCLRTFIDVEVGSRGGGQRVPADGPQMESLGEDEGWRVPIPPGARRVVVGNSCEKGLAPDARGPTRTHGRRSGSASNALNLADIQAKEAFRTYRPGIVADPEPRWPLTGASRKRARLLTQRASLRIGIPRVLAFYSVGPLFRTYFEALGIRPGNVVFSDRTSRELYKEGGMHGAIDPCFPSKVAGAHVHNLLFRKHVAKPLDIVFFPMIDDVRSCLVNALDHRVCPSITATPLSTKAAFSKEQDLFQQQGVRYLNPFLNIGQRELFERQMYLGLESALGLSKRENRRAVAAGFAAQASFEARLRSTARAELDRLEAEDRIGVVLLGRPYHADRGINHDIPSEFQKAGYPVFTPASLPIDGDLMDRLFGDEVRGGAISHPLDITDVWKNAFSENSNLKLWAAKFCARHPNLVGLEIGSFKCGHDAAIFSVIEGILERSGTPLFYFRDLDENKPSASIKIRLETAFYALARARSGPATRRAS